MKETLYVAARPPATGINNTAEQQNEKKLCQKKQCQHYNDTKRVDTNLCQLKQCQQKNDTPRADTYLFFYTS
ncbi:hypothetical protein [Niabella beijingensis]|uniref:hypothetical protein n=1 Tax=Niabella beijingensis TaxID=2872700 RepID=UPI001CBC624F|nr:hypothetical protein [Niabella beijingensis]MBZ4192163.1 hypothetical protein [Niabella beijingensis]